MAQDDGEEKKIASEIELARHELEMDVEKREKEAKQKLDEILSDKRMRLCGRCGKKVGSRIDWAGKCLWEDCEKLLCMSCWKVDKYRFCRAHSVLVHGRPESQARKREFFREEAKLDMRAEMEKDDDSRLNKLQYLASEFARFLEKRMDKSGLIDWTPTGYLQKAEKKLEKKNGDFVISIKVKKWFRSKVRLSVVVASVDMKQQFDPNSLTAYLHKSARRYGGYKLFVLVTEGVPLDGVNFVNGFYDREFSLYVVEPRQGNFYYNIKDTVTNGYSVWFNQKREPRSFRERLKELSDIVSGRLVVSEKSVSGEFGFSGHDAHDILKSCRFLEPIKGTDTFFWKEEK